MNNKELWDKITRIINIYANIYSGPEPYPHFPDLKSEYDYVLKRMSEVYKSDTHLKLFDVLKTKPDADVTYEFIKIFRGPQYLVKPPEYHQ